MARPETEPQTPFAKRLRAVRRELEDVERDQFATQLGISVNTLARYERGERTPDADLLAVYRNRFGVNINWLVTGDGAMFIELVEVPAQQLDDWTMRRMAAAVTAVYNERKLPISPENVAVEAALLYNELVRRVEDLTDQDEIVAALPQLRHLLNKRLNDAEAEPGSGKASA